MACCAVRYTDVSVKLRDPAYSGYFLKFKQGGASKGNNTVSPRCTAGLCSDLYHSQDQTPVNHKI